MKGRPDYMHLAAVKIFHSILVPCRNQGRLTRDELNALFDAWDCMRRSKTRHERRLLQKARTA